MRLSTKILWPVAAATVCAGLAVLAVTFWMLWSGHQRSGRIVGLELFRSGEEVIAAGTPYVLGELTRTLSGVDPEDQRERVLAYLRARDPDETRAVVIDRQGTLIRGPKDDWIPEVVNKELVDRAWETFEATGEAIFEVETYEDYFDEEIETPPVYYRFVILDEADLAVGFGRRMDATAERLENLDKFHEQRLYQLLAIGLGVVAVASGLAFLGAQLFLRQRVLDRLDALLEGITRVAAGDLSHRVLVGEPDEVGRLNHSFNTMTARLHDALADVRAKEEDLATTLSSIGDAVLATDAEGVVTLMNPVAERLTGWNAEEAIGKKLDAVFAIRSSLTGEVAESPVEHVLRSGEIVGLANHTTLLARDGRELQIADSGAPIFDRQRAIRGVVLVFRDVTKEYALQAQLRHAQKMEAVGQLAGGVAHDFNNLLVVIMGSLELAMRRAGVQEDAQLRRELSDIERAADRAATLTRQLLIFGRKQEPAFQLVDVGQVISDMTRMLERLIPSSIVVTRSLDEGTPAYADPGQIEQAITNLCINARDAMPEGGTLDIVLAQVEVDAAASELHPNARQEIYLKVSIKDSGSGIPPDVKERIFEPFFTTKEAGDGTGLGLSVVYSIMEQHDGFCTVESAPGEGTRFDLYFPATTGEADGSRVREATQVRGGSERILVAEDEPEVRYILTEMLTRAGYDVVAMADGPTALEAIRARQGQLDLVILDAVMPQMGGARVYREMRSEGIDLPTLFCTGYADEQLPEDISREQLVLNKPFKLDELLRRVREVLDRGGQAKRMGQD